MSAPLRREGEEEKGGNSPNLLLSSSPPLLLSPSRRWGGAAAGGLTYVAVAVLLFSTSPVLVRVAEPLSAFEITFWRMAIAAGAVLGAAAVSGTLAELSWDRAPRFVGYGLIAALHFLCYIASLSYTTIAHSLAIVYTAPIFVTLFSAWLLGEPIAPRKYIGVAVSVVGIAIVAGFEPRLSGTMLFGDLLALGSAVMFGLYSVAGRYERERYSLFTYAGTVYAGAALWVLPAALVQWTGAYTGRTVAALAGLGIGPLGLGHTLYNASLRRVHATYVNLIATQEVTGGILLGYWLLGEVPSVNSVVGAAIALAGIVLVLI